MIAPSPQNNRSISGTASLLVALTGNLVLAGIFLNALLNPLENADFIFKTGMWLFIVEFLSIFTISHEYPPAKWPAGLFGRLASIFIVFASIGIFAFGFGYMIFRNFYLPSIFMASSLAKMLGKRASHSKNATQWMPYVLLILFSIIIVFGALTPERLVQWFPFSDEVLGRAPEHIRESIRSGNTRGEFVERPQTLLAWGIIYYTLAALLELSLFFELHTKISVKIFRRSP